MIHYGHLNFRQFVLFRGAPNFSKDHSELVDSGVEIILFKSNSQDNRSMEVQMFHYIV